MNDRTHGISAAITCGCVLLLTACSSIAAPSESDPEPTRPSSSSLRLPDEPARFDYQLGGPYAPPAGATVVARDRTAQPAGAGYDICYVNGFQTQPDASESFAASHPELLVQTESGPLVDPGWPDEYLFDTSSADKRAALADLVREWIVGCANAGFAAVEIDNLDSYTRSHDSLTDENNLGLASAYADIAHNAGLAIAQKNTADQTTALRALGYDFAVTESCYKFNECEAYTDEYPVVLNVEYTDELGRNGFHEACADPRHPTTMILRDHDLTTPENADYVYETCP